MKKRIALIAGCSHAAGSEIDGSQDSLFNRRNSYGSLVAEKLDREPINIALTGGSNGSIARSILNWFGTNYDPDSMDVYVIVSWTDACRIEIPLDDHGFAYHLGNEASDWFDVSANDYMRVIFGWEGSHTREKEISKFFHEVMAKHEDLMEIWALNYILQIQYFLNSKNIKYVMNSAMPTFNYNRSVLKPYIENVDETRYYDISASGENTFYWRYKNLGYDNPKAKYWHHGIEPHKLYAEELYNFIKEQHND